MKSRLPLCWLLVCTFLPGLGSAQSEKTKEFWNQREFWDNPSLNTPYKANLNDDEKVAGLSKLWAEVKYNFINFDLVPDLDWDAAYLEYLPKVRQTGSTLEYYQVLRAFAAKLRDGHTFVSLPKELTSEVSSQPLLRVRLIEDKVIIVKVFDDALRKSGIVPGDEVLKISDLDVRQYAERHVMPFRSYSTKQDMETQVFEYSLLAGPSNSEIELTLRGESDRVFKHNVRRVSTEDRAYLDIPRIPPFEYKLLPENIAYVALNTFISDEASDQFEIRFEEIARSDGLIIDLRKNRGGNSEYGDRVLTHLTDKPLKTTSWYTRNYRPAFRAWGRVQDAYGEIDAVKPDHKHFYARPIIVLTGPRTYSAAENFVVAFVGMKRGLVIGEPTGGSTGQPLFFNLPGGGSARVCTKRNKFPDEQEFIGKGIEPDRVVRETITDLRAGRDTVLEAAVNELSQILQKN